MRQWWKEHGKKWAFRLCGLALTAAVAVSLLPEAVVVPASAVTQAEIDAMKEEANSLKQQQEEIQDQLDSLAADRENAMARKTLLEQQINATRAEINTIAAQIAKYDELIAQKQEELSQAEAEEQAQYELFCERVRYMEEQGEVSYWSILFSSKDFADLLDNAMMVEEIMDYDNQVMDQLIALREQIEEDKAELESARQAQQAAKEEQEAAQANLKSQEAEVSALIDLFSGWLEGALSAAGAPDVLISLACDGIISGVGGVLSFLPQIALLFFFLSFLEDSGYMSRAAFIMDRLLRRFGLSGKAFIPMLMGFGCSVPAIMGARTMENEKDRRMTILLIPFMSCSAKLPVYGLLSAAFFGPWAGLVVFGLYVIGMVVGILSGILFKHTLFSGEPAPFVLELPPYRFPSIENIATHVWQKVKGFLVKAGTLILAMSVVLWLLQSFDFSLHMVDDAANSMLGTLGALIAPVFAPLGFGFWQAAVALLTGFIAKEMVVSSLSMFYGFSLTAAGTAVAAAMTGFTPLSAFSMLVFILLYVPCVAATSTMAKELGSAKWTAFSVCWQIGVAYVVSLLVHTVGLALGFV